MKSYLILRLSGPLQAWGQPTFEGTRPSASFPTRSGLLGLIGACVGIRRNDKTALQNLADSVRFAVRCDIHSVDGREIPVTKLTDYHTVQNAREDYRGLKSHDTIQTWREYLCDAQFTVAVWCTDNSFYTLQEITNAVQKPYFTPYLGRRSCPLTCPLYLANCEATDPQHALMQIDGNGAIFSEEAIGADNRRFRVRDEPIVALPRQFATREWFVIQGGA
jgi:CRISPR system Cascade subunit CasD